MAEAKDLEAEIARLQREVDALKQSETLPDTSTALEKYDLNENEERVLHLLALGLDKKEASRAIGMSDRYAQSRLAESASFAKAFQEVRTEFSLWQEARLRFVLPKAWRDVDRILDKDPEEFEESDSKYAAALWRVKQALLSDLLKLNYGQESTVVHRHELDVPMLQVAETSIGLIAEHLAKLTLEDHRGTLSDRLPENQIIDLEPEKYSLNFNHQPRREDGASRCLECGAWVQQLGAHIGSVHNMNARSYKAKNHLDPLEGIDAKPETAD